MKKTGILFSIILWSLIAVIILGFLVVGFFVKFDFGQIGRSGAVSLVKEESYSLLDIKQVVVECHFDIKTALVGGDDLSVRQYDTDSDALFTSRFDGNTLYIKQERHGEWFQFFFRDTGRLELDLPQGYDGGIRFVSASGDVTVPGDVRWQEVSLQSTSGDIRLDGTLDCASARIKSTSGTLRLSGDVRSSGALELSSLSGDVRTQALTGQTVEVSSTSGDVSLGDVTAERYVLRCTSGNIRANSLSGGGSLSNTSGGIDAALLELTGDVEARSTSGSVSLRVQKGLSFLVEASVTSGSIRSGFALPVSDSRGRHASGTIGDNARWRLSLSSTSGDISLYEIP